MNYYVELGSVVNTCLVDENYIISYQSFPFSKDVFNRICDVAGVSIDTLVFIFDGYITTSKNETDYVAYAKNMKDGIYYSCYNKEDVRKLLLLAEMLKVKNVRIFDRFGYFRSISTDNSIVIGNRFNLYTIYVRGGNTEFVEYVNGAMLSTRIASIMKSTGITSLIDADSEMTNAALKFYSNLSTIPDELLSKIISKLSLFLCASKKEGYDLIIKPSNRKASDNAEIPDIKIKQSPADNQRIKDSIEDSLEKDNEKNGISEEDILGKIDEIGAEDQIMDEELSDNSIDDTILEGEEEDEETESNDESEDGNAEFEEYGNSQEPMFSIEEENVSTEGDSSKEKKHNGGRKVLKVAGVSIILAGIAASVLMQATASVYVKKAVDADRQIAEMNVEIDSIEKQNEKVNEMVVFDDKVIDNLLSLTNLALDGYVGSATCTRDGYEMLVYLYKNDKVNDVEELIKETIKAKEVESIDAGRLDVVNGILYKYRITVRM